MSFRAVGDKIRVSNETYKILVAQIGGYEFKWSHVVDNRDGIETDGRIIILGSRKTLEMLANATNIGADGSFSRAPLGFMQFYSVHTNVEQSYKPCKVCPKNIEPP
uniref:Uncharacterized protein n=1 Tax=Panagrolaimus superbus TaxID=310955 RepID=A0A914XRR7_9BILA